MQAEMYGYEAATPTMVIATHLQEIARSHADELLTRESTKQLIDQLKSASPTVVDELIPGMMKLADVQQISSNAPPRRYPIRQLGTIVETLATLLPEPKIL